MAELFKELEGVDTPLRRARHSLNLSARTVADEIGLEKSTYCRIERGYTMPRNADRLRSILDYYGQRGITLTAEEIIFPNPKPSRQ